MVIIAHLCFNTIYYCRATAKLENSNKKSRKIFKNIFKSLVLTRMRKIKILKNHASGFFVDIFCLLCHLVGVRFWIYLICGKSETRGRKFDFRKSKRQTGLAGQYKQEVLESFLGATGNCPFKMFLERIKMISPV